ncbi:lipopolysaccharide assembly protein LapA domain-containing protein [Pseudomonas sp. FSL W5-0299]|uniref:lipopolysaccharide assembly protein LapA domain-containing protein n=1 Tax=Pseudomonas sp. FSL W5-0299 TaxID=1917484 RepID=UPI00098AD4DC|nr:lipopolysaccharide assembly protein LapA domain-containing protein [Pseudomonas sp. FSL W5-0299]OOL38573.1 hypothetical protein BOO94_07475 [Pseudomonas sp. FSL W5-0299]
MKKKLAVLLVFLVVLVVLGFTLENQQPVELVFLGVQTPRLPISRFIILALLIGMLVGPVLRTLLLLHRRRGRDLNQAHMRYQ